MIWLSSAQSVNLSKRSRLLSNGADGKTDVNGTRGSGGGAGGSIQLITNSISGDALIEVRGGHGSQGGGGGGSGGRLVVDLLKSYLNKN